MPSRMSALSPHSAWVHQYDRQHLVDSAYVSADELVASQTAFNVDLLGSGSESVRGEPQRRRAV